MSLPAPGTGALARPPGVRCPASLSDSTEAYDRGEKFAHYRKLPSLREYVLVSQHEPRIESYFRNQAGEWVLNEARAGETLAIRSLESVRLDVDAVYRDPLAG